MSHACDFCDALNADEVRYSDRIAIGRKRLDVDGLLKTVCSACGEEYVTEEQHDRNLALIQAATSSTPEAVSVGHLRAFRARWGLSQRAASSLFGAGESSFGKWESGGLPSGPAALLLQCASHVSGVTEYLARLQKIELPCNPEFADWQSRSGECTGVTPSLARVQKPRPSSHSLPGNGFGVQRVSYQRDIVRLYGEAA